MELSVYPLHQEQSHDKGENEPRGHGQVDPVEPHDPGEEQHYVIGNPI